MKNTLISSVAAVALLGAGCTGSFSDKTHENIAKACAAWTGAFAIFETAAVGGQIPQSWIDKVEDANEGAADLCAHQAEITDFTSAGLAIAHAYVVIMQAIRASHVVVE